MTMSIWLAVAAGGALGAMARHGVSQMAMKFLGPQFPWGTLTANVAGSFAMGAVIVWLARHEPQTSAMRAFLTVGLLGAFTTFSTFALDAVTLYKDRSVTVVGVYVLASVFLSIVGLISGMAFLRGST